MKFTMPVNDAMEIDTEPPTKKARVDNGYTLIKQLHPFNSNWTAKLRCTRKEQVRTFTSRKGGEGKVTSVNFMDSEGDEIRASMFNEAVDKFYGVLKKGGVYEISKAKLTLSGKN